MEPTPEEIEAASHCGHYMEECLIPDPFRLEVYNEIVWCWMCADCAHERQMEV